MAEFWHDTKKVEHEVEQQKEWEKFWRANPHLLTEKTWQRSHQDPNWTWPNPTSMKFHDQMTDKLVFKKEEEGGPGTGQPGSQAECPIGRCRPETA